MDRFPTRSSPPKDANGNLTTMVYDARNLLVPRSVQGKETAPGVWSGDAPTAPTEQVTCDLDTVPAHITVETRQAKDGDTLTVHRYVDGRGRTIQERHQAEPDPDTLATRWRVTGWQVQDVKGNTVVAYQPVFGDTEAYSPGDTTVPSVTTLYDPLSRAAGAILQLRGHAPDGTILGADEMTRVTDSRGETDDSVRKLVQRTRRKG